MECIHTESKHRARLDQLTADCERCCGLCCVAFYFSRSQGFPADKQAGSPCRYLAADDRCAVHGELQQRGLRGCAAYDCFGAGQAVTQAFAGRSWREFPCGGTELFEAFSLAEELHRILWHLAQASLLVCARPLGDEIDRLIAEIDIWVGQGPSAWKTPDPEPVFAKAGSLIRSAGRMAWEALGKRHRGRSGGDYLGRQFHGADLTGLDFSGALMMACDLRKCRARGTSFLGADLRDADLSGADLRESLFLTQRQVNTAKGDLHTQLPDYLSVPNAWGNDG